MGHLLETCQYHLLRAKFTKKRRTSLLSFEERKSHVVFALRDIKCQRPPWCSFTGRHLYSQTRYTGYKTSFEGLAVHFAQATSLLSYLRHFFVLTADKLYKEKSVKDNGFSYFTWFNCLIIQREMFPINQNFKVHPHFHSSLLWLWHLCNMKNLGNVTSRGFKITSVAASFCLSKRSSAFMFSSLRFLSSSHSLFFLFAICLSIFSLCRPPSAAENRSDLMWQKGGGLLDLPRQTGRVHCC